jgi:hypothetical protein
MPTTTRRGRDTGVTYPAWVYEKITAGDVLRDPETHEYRVYGHTPKSGDNICSEAVYWLDDHNYITLHRDGTVTPTTAGDAWHAAETAGVDRSASGKRRTTATTVTFQTAAA